MATPTHSHWRNDPGIVNAFRNAPALKQGATGSAVQRLREALQNVGAPPLAEEPLDQFKGSTATQVKIFQGLYGLAVDGAAGAGTLSKLDALLWGGPNGLKLWPKGTPPVRPAASNEDFLQELATEGGPVAKKAGLPVSAMLACGAVESGWGRGKIYRETGSLFSLQKWPKVLFPTTARTLWRTTIIQTHPEKTALAPFNTATGHADAVRQWCEWIQHYGAADGPPGNPEGRLVANQSAIGRRQQLMGMVNDPMQFARNLYLVSFGESQAKGKLYSDVLQENNLTRFD